MMERRGATSLGDGAAGESRAGFCAYLRGRREARGVSLADIARETRIPLHNLERIEEGRFEELPADVFVRGFLRSYARCLGLDVDETVRRYAACGLNPAPVTADEIGGLADAGDDARADVGPVKRAGRIADAGVAGDGDAGSSSAPATDGAGERSPPVPVDDRGAASAGGEEAARGRDPSPALGEGAAGPASRAGPAAASPPGEPGADADAAPNRGEQFAKPDGIGEETSAVVASAGEEAPGRGHGGASAPEREAPEPGKAQGETAPAVRADGQEAGGEARGAVAKGAGKKRRRRRGKSGGRRRRGAREREYRPEHDTRPRGDGSEAASTKGSAAASTKGSAAASTKGSAAASGSGPAPPDAAAAGPELSRPSTEAALEDAQPALGETESAPAESVSAPRESAAAGSTPAESVSAPRESAAADSTPAESVSAPRESAAAGAPAAAAASGNSPLKPAGADDAGAPTSGSRGGSGAREGASPSSGAAARGGPILRIDDSDPDGAERGEDAAADRESGGPGGGDPLGPEILSELAGPGSRRLRLALPAFLLALVVVSTIALAALMRAPSASSSGAPEAGAAGGGAEAPRDTNSGGRRATP